MKINHEMTSYYYDFDQIFSAVQGIYSTRRVVAVGLLTALGFFLVVNSSWHATPDSALYLELGESLAAGTGYQFNGEPHTYVPPGYPALVSIWAYFLGANFFAYRALMALMGLLTAAVGYLLILRLCGRDTALVVGGLFAINHVLLQNSTYTTSDVPFALFSLLALHATVSAARGSARIRIVAAGLVMGLPPLFRINGWGLPPVAAFFLFCAWKDRPLYKRVGWAAAFLLISFIPTLGWELYKSSFPASIHEGTYINALTGRAPDMQIWIILKSAWDYVYESSYALTGLSIKTGFFKLIYPLLIIIGMATALRRGDRLFAPMTLVQAAGLLLAPAGSRYLILLLPGMYLFLGLGLIRVSDWFGKFEKGPARIIPRPRGLVLGAFIVLAALNLGHNAITIFQARNSLESYGAESSRDLPFFQAARWLWTQPSDTVVMTMHPRVVHYLSGLKTVELVRSGVPEHQAWIEDADEIRDLVRDGKPAFLFSDASNIRRFKKTVAAIESLGLLLKEVPEAMPVPSKRFRLWKICYTDC